MCALESSPVISHLCQLPAVELTHFHQASSLHYKSLVVISPSHVYCESEEWSCVALACWLARSEPFTHEIDHKGAPCNSCHVFPNVGFFTGHHVDHAGHSGLWLQVTWQRPAPGWAGRAHQKAEVWFNTWNMSEQRLVSLVFTAKAAKHAQWAGMTASLSRAWFRSRWEGRSKWDALKASQDAHRGWSASKSYTLIWVNSELSHIACKVMGVRVRGHFKELWWSSGVGNYLPKGNRKQQTYQQVLLK